MAEYTMTVEYKVTVPDDVDHQSEQWQAVKEEVEGELTGDVSAYLTVPAEDADDDDQEHELKLEQGEIIWQTATDFAVV